MVETQAFVRGNDNSRTAQRIGVSHLYSYLIFGVTLRVSTMGMQAEKNLATSRN